MTRLRSRPGLVLFLASVLIGSIAALNARISSDLFTPFVLMAIVAIVVGKQLPMRLSRRIIAPLTVAPALGLALSPHAVSGGASASTVLAIIWLSALVGSLVARVRRHPVDEGSLGARFLGMTVTTVLARGVDVDGQTLVEWAFAPGTQPAAGALGLLLVAAAGGIFERVLEMVTAWLVERRPLRGVVATEIGPLAGISAATVSTGPLIAFASLVVDWVSIPLMLIPLLITHLAVNRVVGIRQALDQSVLAMSRLTELAGISRPGHVQRVADLSVMIGREMDLDVLTLRDVERTALLHDLGQLGLQHPLRGGATLHAGASEQEVMARTAVEMISGSPQLASLAGFLDQVRTPFRRTREFGEHIPLPSRIVRVANAWEDITEGTRSRRAQAVALERLHLGLGYDYDPEIVAALERTLRA